MPGRDFNPFRNFIIVGYIWVWNFEEGRNMGGIVIIAKV
jgi:hypothetical protein